MKRQGDIDGVLEAWFLDGPTAMPDRLFDAVLDRVERVPQRRLARLQLRFNDMSTTARWLAAGAAAVLVVGIGFAALGRGPGPGPGVLPSPSPTPSQTAAPSTAADLLVPEALQHPYLGALRTVDDVQMGDVSQFSLSPRTYTYHNGLADYLYSAAGVEGDEIVLRSGTASSQCEDGDEGRYPFSTTPGGSILTIEPGIDDCAPRAQAVPGTWQRSDCRNPDNWCLGEVEAGTYKSQHFDPVASSSDAWRADFGALTYTVPDGWANNDDWPSMYGFMRASSYAAGGVNDGQVAPDTVTLLARPAAASLDNCAEAAEPGVGTDRAAITAWILAHPGLVVTERPSITLDGLPASVLDLAVRADWTETCDQDNPFVAAPVLIGDYHWALGTGDRMRVILLDLPSGTTVAVSIDPEDPATFDSLVAETMPIVESFDFR
ncbi:MAG TPA: hypothetical protein VK871_11380 [Candidatus Limnocylindrales bacterium]|nr:hypothetical protein [Candidatus Limnocylindrales bacterium]